MEPILNAGNERFSMIPINETYRDIWDLFMKHSAAFWRHTEIDYMADIEDWKQLREEEQEFIGYILAFFSGADGIVLENLVSNFCNEIKIPEARAFLAFQSMIEVEHSITYGLLIETYITDETKKNQYIYAIDHIPVVTKKALWATKYMDSKIPFALRLIAFAVIEGVYFSGAFCSIFWLKDKQKMVRALGLSNELIARDEGLHVEFAVTLFNHLKHRPEQQIVHELVLEAVTIEKEFIIEAIPCKMIGMNADLMIQYIEYVADRLLKKIGYDILFNSQCPFDFMQKISLDGKSNFFEKRVSEYKLNVDKPKQDAFLPPDDDDF
jgi:ribonucleotide reductase beta subunit family protein with ferritin-like domain